MDALAADDAGGFATGGADSAAGERVVPGAAGASRAGAGLLASFHSCVPLYSWTNSALVYSTPSSSYRRSSSERAFRAAAAAAGPALDACFAPEGFPTTFPMRCGATVTGGFGGGFGGDSTSESAHVTSEAWSDMLEASPSSSSLAEPRHVNAAVRARRLPTRARRRVRRFSWRRRPGCLATQMSSCRAGIGAARLFTFFTDPQRRQKCQTIAISAAAIVKATGADQY